MMRIVDEIFDFWSINPLNNLHIVYVKNYKLDFYKQQNDCLRNGLKRILEGRQ